VPTSPRPLVTLAVGLATGLALAAGSAHAESKSPVLETPRPWTGYVRTPGAARATGTTSSATSSKIVYVKRCIGGCDVHYAPVDDSRTGASSIAAQGSVRTIGEFKQPLSVWNELMACVKETFAPFDITVTDVKPSDGTTPHFLNIVGGKPTDLHPNYTGAGGVAPFDCGEIPNAITYTFDVYGPNALALCWTVSQEVAHAFGLEHAFLVKDPMTYLSGDMPKRFRDVDAACGELEQWARCECGGNTQNTYRHVVGMFGPGAPTPPETTIIHPKEGKQTQPGFTAVVKAIDDVRVEKVELYVDGTLVSTTMTPYGDSYELTTTDFGAGSHVLEVRAIDVQGVAGTATLAFTQGPPCTRDSICTGADVCVSGVCVPGPDMPGGLGSTCSSDTECLSHRCVDGGEQFKRCVDECDLSDSSSCPDDFSCLPAGSEGVCWFTPSGGCCDAGSGPQGPLLLALGLGMLLLRRRRACT
jgi:hypothetical protein